jgi:hypothetical protein
VECIVDSSPIVFANTQAKVFQDIHQILITVFGPASRSDTRRRNEAQGTNVASLSFRGRSYTQDFSTFVQ